MTINFRDYKEVLTKLLDYYCLFLVEIEFVDSVHEWCKREGVEEPDKSKPLKLFANDQKGCKLILNEMVSEKVINDRIKALSIRSALLNVAHNRSDALDSDKKKLAYLFLSEYALTLPDLADNELLADTWVFEQMTKQGFFNE